MLLIVEFCFCFCFFSLHLNSSFLSIRSTFLICLSRTSSLYCRSENFCLMITQIQSNSVLVEQIVFSLKGWLYWMLLFRDLGCSDLACRNAFWSVGLRYKVVWMLLFSSLYNIVSGNVVFHGETWKSNLIVLCFSFKSLYIIFSEIALPLSLSLSLLIQCCERINRSIKRRSVSITLLWTHQRVRLKCLSFFWNFPVNTSKDVIEVSIIFSEPYCEQKKRFDKSVGIFSQHCCEHIKQV